MSQPIKAQDLHKGDTVHEHDWSLHVTTVDVCPSGVAVGVTEFGFLLHYAAGQVLDVDVAL